MLRDDGKILFEVKRCFLVLAMSSDHCYVAVLFYFVCLLFFLFFSGRGGGGLFVHPQRIVRSFCTPIAMT